MKPQVELVQRPDIKDFRQVTKFLEHIARVCYQSEGKISEFSDIELVKKLLSRKHMTIFEHVGFEYPEQYPDDNINFTLRHQLEAHEYYDIVGLEYLLNHPFIPKENKEALTFRIITNRGVTHELVRHRQCSFAQESTRYVKYTTDEDAGQLCILPEWVSMYPILTDEINKWFKEYTLPLYKKILEEAGLQMARGVLPNFLKSEIIVTFHKRVWFDHFLELRTSEAAHPEMRYIANLMKKEVLH